MSATSRKRVHSLLLCQVCYERFQLPEKTPKVLPCQHSFCVGCLEYLASSPTFKCPLCRTPQVVPEAGVSVFPTNLTIVSLMDCYCTLCQNDDTLEQCSHCDKPICTECKELHSEQMSDSALKKLQQLSEGKDTVECLCRDVQKYAQVIGQFIQKNTGSENVTKNTRLEVLQGLCRSLQAEVDTATPLVESTLDLLKTIDTTIENGQTPSCDGSCTSCQQPKKPTDSCDENCDGSCVPAQPGSPHCVSPGTRGEDWFRGYCYPPAAIKQLNRHLNDVKTFTDALVDKSTNLSKMSECYLRRQVNYLVDIGEKFGVKSGQVIKLARTKQPLVRPSFVACHRENGQLYVLDQASNSVIVLSHSGVEVSSFSLGECRDNSQEQFTGLAVNGEGDVLVTDSTRGIVCVYSTSGELQRHIGGHGSKLGQLKRPAGVDCDADDHVHVCDWGNQRVQVFDGNGKYLRKYGDGIAENDIFRPQFLHVSRETGHVYVSDTQNAKVHVFGDHGNHVIRTMEAAFDPVNDTSIPGLEWPAGVSTIKHGYILVADWSGCCVHVLGPSGQYICTWGERGAQPGQFDCPKGIAYSEKGSSVSVCDTVNRRIQLIPV